MDVFSYTMTRPAPYGGLSSRPAVDRLSLGSSAHSSDLRPHTTAQHQGGEMQNLEYYVDSAGLAGTESTSISDRTFTNPAAHLAGRQAQGGNMRSTGDPTMIWRESELRDTGNIGKMDREIHTIDPKATGYQPVSAAMPTVYSWK